MNKYNCPKCNRTSEIVKLNESCPFCDKDKTIKVCPTCETTKESSPTPDGDEICPSCGDREMMDKEEKPKVRLSCLLCGTVYEFDEDSNEARGFHNVFCPDKDCEDRYASKQ